MALMCGSVQICHVVPAPAVQRTCVRTPAARQHGWHVNQVLFKPGCSQLCPSSAGRRAQRTQRLFCPRAAPPEKDQQETSSESGSTNSSDASGNESTSKADDIPQDMPSRIKPLQSSSDSQDTKSRRKAKQGDRMKFDAPHFPAPPRQSRLTSLEQALGFLVATGGVYGTLAVSLAWLAHIEPFGNFHYDRQDILTAVLIFIPVYLTDALILVPEWETEGGAAKLIKDFPVSPVFRPQPPLTDPSSTPSTDPKDLTSSKSTTPPPSKPTLTSLPLDPPSPVPTTAWGISPLPDKIQQDWSFLDATKIALQRTQDSYFQLSFGTILPEYLELLVILVGVLGQEMLYRGVAFTLVSGWLRDRYYEAGADDIVQITSGWSMSTEDVGRWSALGVFAAAGAASVARKMWEASRRNRVLIIPVAGKGAKDVVDVAAESTSNGSNKQRFLQVGPRISQTMALTQLIKGGRDVLESMAACTSFLLTHNLAATYAATVLSELLFSLMQRQGIKRYRRKSNRYYKKLSQALWKAKKNVEAQQGSTSGTGTDKSAFTSTELPTKPASPDVTTNPSNASTSSSDPSLQNGVSSPNASSTESTSSSERSPALNTKLDATSLAASASTVPIDNSDPSTSSSSLLVSHPVQDGLGSMADSASVSSSDGGIVDAVNPITPIDAIEPSRVAGCSSVLPNAPRLDQGETSQNGGAVPEPQDLKRLADELAGSLVPEEEEETAIKHNAR